MTTMTLEEMRAARERGESQSDWKRVHRMVQEGIEPAEDEDSPNAAQAERGCYSIRAGSIMDYPGLTGSMLPRRF